MSTKNIEENQFLSIIMRLMVALKLKNEYNLAEILGFNRDTFSARKKRGAVPVDKIQLLCRERSLNFDWAMTGRGEMSLQSEVQDAFREPKLVPLLGRVSAGFPQLVQEDIIEYISMPDAPNNAFVLIVKGDSMSPEIKEGSYILFIQTGDFKNGDIVVVNNEWGETMCKRFRERDGKIILASDNQEYPAIEPNEHYRIIGKVIESWTRKKH